VKELCEVTASHVNERTGMEYEERSPLRTRGRELSHPKLCIGVEPAGQTNMGGLSLAASVAKRLNLPSMLDKGLSLLKQHRPYTEGDHVLSLTYNLYAGGTCLEDLSFLQGSEGVKALLGAKRLPDPTTAGDFLRRFDEKNLESLSRVIDEAQDEAWRRYFGRKRVDELCLDMDSHVKEVYGDQRECADLSYKGTFGFHPLLLTLGRTGELVSIINRPGNAHTAEGVVTELERHIPRVMKRAKRVIVRGDSGFFSSDIFETCDELGASFTVSGKLSSRIFKQAESIPQSEWQAVPFKESPRKKASCTRKKGANKRRATLRARGKYDIKRIREWTAEAEYYSADVDANYRMIVRRTLVEESNQGTLFPIYRYSVIITNLPKSYTPQRVIRTHYQRADQENVIEQLQSGVCAMRYPAREFRANSAFLLCARLAHNIKCWVCMFFLPTEVLRWEWKRFRHHFVYLAAKVTKHARQVTVHLVGEIKFPDWILKRFTAEST
jgi:hypothetical protein